MSNLILKLVNKFVTLIVVFGLVLSTLFVSLDTVSAEKIEYLQVADTVQGMDTLYLLNKSLDLDRVRLALVNPNRNISILDNVSRSGSVSSTLLSSVGAYELALGYKVNNRYLILDRVKFDVFRSTVNLNSFGMGGDSVLLQSENQRFRFTDIPTDLVPFQPFSVTVEALTAAGTVNTDYTGTIAFESDDSNAQLPDDYTFISADAGVRVFENAFVISEFGNVSLFVEDISDSSLRGEIELDFEVSTTTGADTGLMEVDTPIAGVQTNNQIVFSGRVDPGLEVEILDQGIFLLRTDADAEGAFSVTSSSLPDGEYVFTLRTTNAESDEIAVTITTAAANISSVRVEPSEPAAGEDAEVTVNFNDPVDSVSAIINGVRNPLQAIDNDKKVFRGAIVVPSEPGEYPINLDVTSELGIRTEIEEAASFTVLEARGTAMDISFFVPSRIDGLVATSQDRRVDLSWQPATAEYGIDFYRVFYGTDESNLSFTVDTNSSDTNWYVDNLENGVRYYFQVFGVDNEGNQGDQGSQVVSAIPGVDGSTSLHGIGGDDLVDRTSETGPALYLAILITFIFTLLYYRKSIKV